jgi:hypothetical protein
MSRTGGGEGVDAAGKGVATPGRIGDKRFLLDGGDVSVDVDRVLVIVIRERACVKRRTDNMTARLRERARRARAKVVAGSARGGPSCCTWKRSRGGAVLGSFINLGPLLRFVFDIQRKSSGLDTRFYHLSSLCPRLWKKYKSIIVSFMDFSSLTIILPTPHGLFNIQHRRSVHNLSTHNILCLIILCAGQCCVTWFRAQS